MKIWCHIKVRCDFWKECHYYSLLSSENLEIVCYWKLFNNTRNKTNREHSYKNMKKIFSNECVWLIAWRVSVGIVYIDERTYEHEYRRIFYLIIYSFSWMVHMHPMLMNDNDFFWSFWELTLFFCIVVQ